MYLQLRGPIHQRQAVFRIILKNMLFTGREVRIGKNCARGLENGPRPQASGRTRDRGHSFSQYGPTKAGKKHFYLFLNSIFER